MKVLEWIYTELLEIFPTMTFGEFLMWFFIVIFAFVIVALLNAWEK